MTADTLFSPTFLLAVVLGLLSLCAIAIAIGQHTIRASTGVQPPTPRRANPSALIALVFLVLLGAWYWYSFRPSQIRADCAGKHPPSAPAALRGIFPEAYDRCLAEHGLAR